MALILAADAAQRRRSDAGLSASEERYRQLFDDNPQPMWVFDYETLCFLAVNKAAMRHYGYSREEFLSMALPDLHADGELPRLLEAVASARKGLETPFAGVIGERMELSSMLRWPGRIFFLMGAPQPSC